MLTVWLYYKVLVPLHWSRKGGDMVRGKVKNGYECAIDAQPSIYTPQDVQAHSLLSQFIKESY